MAVGVGEVLAFAVAVGEAVAVGVGLVDSLNVGVTSADALGVAAPATSHVLPFSLKDLGAGLVPDQDARKPVLTAPPAASLPFEAVLVTVTFFPDCFHSAFQPRETF